MKKGLLTLITIVAIALLSTSVFAYGPVLKCMPDIVIGDREDWVGTIDTNLFFFSDAFSFDDYVEDLDTSDAAILWNFTEQDMGTENLEINDIGPVASFPDFGNDLRAVDQMASFHDMLAPSVLMNEDVTFYVSDGTFADSAVISVTTLDDGWDDFITPCVPSVMKTWVFEPPPEGWSFRTAGAPAGIPGWSNATSFTDSNSIGLTAGTSTATDYYGSWDSYIDATTPAITWSANKLWRAIFTLDTDKSSPDQVPSIRLRMALTGQKAAAYIQMYPDSTWIPVAQRGSGTTDFVLYFKPPIADTNGLFAALDLIDFDRTAGVDGTVYLEEVTVDAYDQITCCIDKGWIEYYSAEGTGMAGWSHSSAGVAYLTDVNGYSVDSTAPAGLRQDTTAAQSRAFGAWTSPTDIDILGDQLYRAAFYLVCENSQNVQSNRFRVHSDDFAFAAYMSVEPGIPAESGLPPTFPPKPYYVYFEFPTDPTGIRTDMLAAYDLYDFLGTAGGWAKCTKFTMEKRDP